MHKYFIFFIFCLYSINVLASGSIESVSQSVLDNLFDVTNNKRVSFTPPKVVISEKKKFVAAFFPLKNEIVLEVAAYEVCRSFGRDSLSALAFILSHELTHSFQMEIIKNKQQTSYMAYHKHYDDGFQLEKGADISGAFNAYLAGYKTSGIINKLIDQLYVEYELNDDLNGYPTKEERLNTAEEVSIILDNLIESFEVASYLIAIRKYELAAACYEKILEYYKGREIYNNLGLCYAMHAMEFTNSDIDLYLYPFELDQNSRIKKPKKGRGDEDISPAMKQARFQYLTKALNSLREAASLDQTYFEVDINIVCVYSLMEEYEKAIQHYNNKGMKFRGEMNTTEIYAQRAKVALTIAYAQIKDEKAEELFESLSNSKYPLISYMSKFNERVFLEGKCGVAEEYACVEILDESQTIDGVYLHRPIVKGKEIVLDEGNQLSIFIQQLDSSVVYKFVENDDVVLSMQKIKSNQKVDLESKLSEANKLRTINTNKGSYFVCEQDNIVVSVNSSLSKVNEWVKYLEN